MRRELAVLLALLPAVPAFCDTVDQVATTLAAPAGWDFDRSFWPVAARLSDPALFWAHDVLGGLPTWTALGVWVETCATCAKEAVEVRVHLSDGLVFEDVAPRLWDVTGDGRPEVVVVESSANQGARLAVWGYDDTAAGLTRLAASAFIGTPQRWLAPAGVADFDQDGQIEIAYIDRPDIRGDLVYVRPKGDRLVETARMPGLTNHRIGDRAILGGVRDCGVGPELILASKDWSRLLRVRGTIVQDIGPIPAEGLVIPAC